MRCFLALAALSGFFAACSIHVPWWMTGDYDGVLVVLDVSPDDADVLLNGRFIGAAYEYAAPASPLRLASRANELAFRKKGFREQAVDLSGYPSRRITVKIELQPDVTAANDEPDAAVEDRAYEARSEPLPPMPQKEPAQAPGRFLTEVELALAPEEAALYIDGRFWGLAPAPGKTLFLRLPPGSYEFAAFKPGYSPFAGKIEVPRQEKFNLEIALSK